MKLDKYISGLLKGDALSAARLISMVENTDRNEEIIKRISPSLGNAYVTGITGSPGVGKSTLTDKLVRELRKQDKKVGVIAVDPTSPFSGGAVLGDRIRLQKLSEDDGVFIRSMATRGHLGGISSATSDAVKILDAFGCDYIFIETVGVGQSEIEVVKNVDTTLLVLVPGMGDEIQAIKAGIMEIADIFVVNKADKDGVERIMLEIEMLQNLGETKERLAPICKVIAKDDKGITGLLSEIQNHRKYLEENNLFVKNRKKRLELEMKQIVHDKLLQKAGSVLKENFDFKQLIDEVYENKTDVYSVVNDFIGNVVK
ncbi:MAG: methylmalonyl Co-A mutase-associated GTPase MeaB [Candidatus Cloacimonetes bacterium]|nr:methylmalonyl Co-A mutase-associated GTPase MeaB [Candidatus Cloacimonadota bacterium]MCF7814192.1 methylmalonyl Co-A mutase-associated GTPase MeaB [Candidatus Cloacimonadota bacterium]MCF7868859.1 methylmalonyl Co-A mutase-associated GTPase MeaB [Candidatus Cloacimonadota bacterium]MCF7884248.1 methylmalonyl Co-A mutase-associated GTPase MeaB [Candidatus Cloacimonadota bacterium]